VRPGSPEVCDGVDNDCDGEVDPACSGLIGQEGSCGCETGPPRTASLLVLALLLRRRRP
jgi:uncharacterized protein (TIGR03382 family)